MLFLILILLTGCSYAPFVIKEVSLSSPHAYEEYADVPYYLDYYDGEKFRRVFLSGGVKKIRVAFKGNVLCPVVATPFGFSAPALGSASVPGQDRVSLNESEGALAFALYQASSLNAESVEGLSYERLLKMVPPSFDEARFISQVTTGTFSSFKERGKFSVVISDLPSGLWLSAVSEVANISIENEGDSVCLKLFPGCYSFYNPERKIEYVLEVAEDGKSIGRPKYHE